MKRILITGKNSYVGNSFAKWVEKYPEKYEVEKISLRDGSWKSYDFSKFDCVLHVAGTAHVSTDPKMEEQYYKVNRDLTVEVAKKAKSEGVKQFIYMSSIIVYGNGSQEIMIINDKTLPNPDNFYGKSKLQAEEGLSELEDESFKIAIVRPPMIYGKGSKGNYLKLSNAARKLPIFPNFENQRSMLHIDNLCEFIKLLIGNEESGLFFPQNKEYVNTSHLVKTIAEINGRKIRLVKSFNPLIKPLIKRINIVNKVFGTLAYDMDLSHYKYDYRIRDFKESITLTER